MQIHKKATKAVVIDAYYLSNLHLAPHSRHILRGEKILDFQSKKAAGMISLLPFSIFSN